MIVGLGVDVVGLERFEQAIRRAGVVERLFGEAERAGAERLGVEGLSGARAVEWLAGRFAAKEALAKALGAPGGLVWTDVSVGSGASGRPELAMTGTVAARAAELGVGAAHVSITHDAGVAVAVVVLESERN